MSRIISIGTVCLILILAIFAFVIPKDILNFDTKEEKIVVKNGAGKGIDVTVPAHPRRVIFLNSSSMDLWLGAGGKDKIAGYIEFKTAPNKLYENLNKDSVKLGTNIHISIEKILKLKPDLVISSGSGRPQANLLEGLKQLQVPFLAIENESIEDTFYEFRLYGQMNNTKDIVEKEIKRINASINNIVKSYENKQKPKVALIWGSPSSFTFMKPSSRQGQMLSLAGGKNIVKDDNSSSRYVPISMEYIAKEDPDYILFITMGQSEQMEEAVQNFLKDASSWQILRAVKNNNVHILPKELFTAHYGLSIDESVKYINNILY